MDFQENITYEVILSTTNMDKPFVAPIGVVYRNSVFETKLYRSTVTYQNLIKNPFGAIIVVNDGLVFYRAIYEKQKLLLNMHSHRGFWVLREAAAWIGFKVIDEEKEQNLERSILCLKPISGSLLRVKPSVYSRVDSALVEMLIHHSRLKPYVEAGMLNEALKLYELMVHYDSLIKRIAPNSEYKECSAYLFEQASRFMKSVKNGAERVA